jgi:hypothetical protein
VLFVGVHTTYNLTYLIVNEVFPTIYLATAYGVCNVIARAITILSPLVARAPEPIPLILLGIVSFICISLPFYLVNSKKLN